MRDVYDGLQDLLAHTARQIADGLEEEYARMLDVMYFPQLVPSYLFRHTAHDRDIWSLCLLAKMVNRRSCSRDGTVGSPPARTSSLRALRQSV